MLDHVSLGSHDFARAVAFYEAVLASLGLSLHRRQDDEAAFGTATAWMFFLYPLLAGDHAPGARMHVAFRAPDRESVRRAHAEAVARGAEELRPADARPQFGEDYFGGVF